MNTHFRDVNSIAVMMGKASEIQKYNFWTILIGIAKSKTANDLLRMAEDMDYLLDSVSKEIHAKDMKVFIDNHLKEYHEQSVDKDTDNASSQ